MKTSKCLWRTLILLLAITALIIFVRRAEDATKGRANAQLLLALAGSAQGRELAIAEQKIRDMGTNAIPSLLRAFQTDFSPLHQSLSLWVRRQRWLFPLRRLYPGFERPEDLLRGAEEAFRILGPMAYPAAPSLDDALTNPVSGFWAMRTLVRQSDRGELILGPGIYASFLKGLTNNDPRVREMAAIGLGAAQTDADVVVPALLRSLKDPSAQVRSQAAFQLGGRAYNVKSVDIVPALITLLSDDDSSVRKSASLRLKMIGAAATNALPALSRLSTEDIDLEVRNTATDAMHEIGAKAQ